MSSALSTGRNFPSSINTTHSGTTLTRTVGLSPPMCSKNGKSSVTQPAMTISPRPMRKVSPIPTRLHSPRLIAKPICAPHTQSSNNDSVRMRAETPRLRKEQRREPASPHRSGPPRPRITDRIPADHLRPRRHRSADSAGPIPQRPGHRHLQRPIRPYPYTFQTAARWRVRARDHAEEGRTLRTSSARVRTIEQPPPRGGETTAADFSDDRHGLGQNRIIPLPDPRPCRPPPAAGRYRSQRAHPLPDECPRHRPSPTVGSNDHRGPACRWNPCCYLHR